MTLDIVGAGPVPWYRPVGAGRRSVSGSIIQFDLGRLAPKKEKRPDAGVLKPKNYFLLRKAANLEAGELPRLRPVLAVEVIEIHGSMSRSAPLSDT